MAKKTTTAKVSDNAGNEEVKDNGELLKQVEDLTGELERCKEECERVTGEFMEWKQKYDELISSSMPNFEPDPYLVVIPYKASEAQGDELMLAIRGWMTHFKEKFSIVVVGDVDELEFPEVSGGCIEIGVIPHECKTDNPPLDVVAKLLTVVSEFPEREGLIVTNDDIYPVRDFDVSVVKLLKVDGLLTDAKRCGELYGINRGNTLKVLQKEGLPVFDYGCHLPVFYEVEKLISLIDKYDLSKNAMLIGSLYFNLYYSTHVPTRLDFDRDNLKVIVGRKNADWKLLRSFIRDGKIFVNNSVEGWSEEMEKVISEHV